MSNHSNASRYDSDPATTTSPNDSASLQQGTAATCSETSPAAQIASISVDKIESLAKDLATHIDQLKPSADTYQCPKSIHGSLTSQGKASSSKMTKLLDDQHSDVFDGSRRDDGDLNEEHTASCYLTLAKATILPLTRKAVRRILRPVPDVIELPWADGQSVESLTDAQRATYDELQDASRMGATMYRQEMEYRLASALLRAAVAGRSTISESSQSLIRTFYQGDLDAAERAYQNLRLSMRLAGDEETYRLHEAWRMHQALMGSADEAASRVLKAKDDASRPYGSLSEAEVLQAKP